MVLAQAFFNCFYRCMLVLDYVFKCKMINYFNFRFRKDQMTTHAIMWRKFITTKKLVSFAYSTATFPKTVFISGSDKKDVETTRIQYFHNMQYQVDPTNLTPENGQKTLFGTLDHPKRIFCDFWMIQHGRYDSPHVKII